MHAALHILLHRVIKAIRRRRPANEAGHHEAIHLQDVHLPFIRMDEEDIQEIPGQRVENGELLTQTDFIIFLFLHFTGNIQAIEDGLHVVIRRIHLETGDDAGRADGAIIEVGNRISGNLHISLLVALHHRFAAEFLIHSLPLLRTWDEGNHVTQRVIHRAMRREGAHIFLRGAIQRKAHIGGEVEVENPLGLRDGLEEQLHLGLENTLRPADLRDVPGVLHENLLPFPVKYIGLHRIDLISIIHLRLRGRPVPQRAHGAIRAGLLKPHHVLIAMLPVIVLTAMKRKTPRRLVGIQHAKSFQVAQLDHLIRLI